MPACQRLARRGTGMFTHTAMAGRSAEKNGNPACHRHVYYAVHALCCLALAGRTVALPQNMECLDVDKK